MSEIFRQPQETSDTCINFILYLTRICTRDTHSIRTCLSFLKMMTRGILRLLIPFRVFCCHRLFLRTSSSHLFLIPRNDVRVLGRFQEEILYSGHLMVSSFSRQWKEEIFAQIPDALWSYVSLHYNRTGHLVLKEPIEVFDEWIRKSKLLQM